MHFLAKQTVGKALNNLEGTVSAWKINGYGDPSRKNNSRYTKIVRYLLKGHSFCKKCLHDLQFMKTRSSSPNLSKLARADMSCQFTKTRSLCRTVYKTNRF